MALVCLRYLCVCVYACVRVRVCVWYVRAQLK